MSKSNLRLVIWGLALFGLFLTINLGNVAAQDAPEAEPLTHVVQPGENLYRIALRYGVDLEELIAVNNITDRSHIFRGQVLIIPGLTVPDESAEVFNPLIAGTPVIHVVHPGETLSGIARQYQMTVEQLLAANSIGNPNLIFRGQELQVWTPETVDAGVDANAPEGSSDAVAQGAPPAANTIYIVQAGEHLSQIARRYGMSWTVLAQANGITDPNTIYAGQELMIPALNEAGGIIDMGVLYLPIP